MDPSYGERYRELFERHWWWRARTEFIVETLRRLQPPAGWKTILDIGCGDALFFDRLSEFGEVEGVEPEADLVDEKNPYRSRVHAGSFDDFHPGKQYSLVLMLDVLEHIEKPVPTLRRALELLQPDGFFIATVPAFMSLWTSHDVLNRHFTRYTKPTFRAVASEAGLSIREERYIYHWTCPVKLLAHAGEQVLGSKPAPPKVPPALINQPLYWLSRIEQKTISRLPMPFGSSLMVVGTKAS